ncbi:MAG: hypothetical protein Tsb002_16070 [Wenzhouxiangellaceae bacterium]
MNKALLTSLLLVLLLAGGKVHAEDDVDYIELAALMLRDGNIERALSALGQAETEVEEFDWARYHTLYGMAYLRSGDKEQAKQALDQAVAAGASDAVVFIYLAQVNFELGDYNGALTALDLAGAEVARIASTYHMRAQSHWLLEQHLAALAVLDQAAQVFPADPSFQRRKVFYLIELGLYQEAASQGQEYLQRSAGAVEDYVAIGDAMRRSGQVEQALQFLEAARLLFPENTLVSKALAHAYIDDQSLHVAAGIIDQAAHRDAALIPEAAELYRQAGQTYRALLLNSQVRDQDAKLKQRLALLLELSHYEQAAAMEQDLYRRGLLDNEDIRYALAYALFKAGNYDRAEAQLSLLRRSDLFRKAVEVRRAIEECRAAPWRCG